MIETLLGTWILNKIFRPMQQYIIMGFLLLGNLIFGKYSSLFLSKDFNSLFTRNVLFTGIPFFLLGKWLSVYKNIIKKHLIQLLVITTIVFGIEFLSTTKGILISTGNIYISNILLGGELIIISLYLNDIFSPTPLSRWLAIIGKKYSLYIYIFHVAIISTVNFLIEKYTISLEKLSYKIGYSFLILFCSFVAADIFVKVKNIICAKTNKSNMK